MEVMWIIVGVVLAGNISLWIFFLPRYVLRKVNQMQDEMVNRHYGEVESMYRRMRGWRHDYHNHMQVLKAHLGLGQYAEAQEYLKRLEEDLAGVDTVLKTGNVMVDAILNSKLTLIRERGIQVDATAIAPRDVGISGVDLSILIGNLLGNAMEACEKVPREDRFIRIYVDILKKQFYICVTNSMAGKAKKAGMGFFSSKGADHGLGLLRIDSIVEKYHGYLNRQAEDGVFATEVTLPLAQE